jgi:DNA-binding NarL/FixJ family response regulator
VIDLRLSTKACATQVDKSFDGLRFEEELEHGLRLLDKEHPNQRLRELAVLKINGMSNAKIAEEFRWSRKTVALRLNLIFEIWREASEA